MDACRVCLVSLIRLISLSKLDITDPTYSIAILAYWGAVEVNLPIICACLATIRPLLNRLFPGLLGPRTSQEAPSFVASSRRQCAVRESVTEVQGAEDGSSRESFVFMLHEVEAPGRAYGGLGKGECV